MKESDKTRSDTDKEYPISSDLIYQPNVSVEFVQMYANEQEAARGKKLGMAIHHWQHADAEAERLLTLYRSRDVMETIEFLEANPVGPFTVFRLIELADRESRHEHAKKGAFGKQKKQPYTAIRAKILEFFKTDAAAIDTSTGMPKHRTQAAFINAAIRKFGIETASGTKPGEKAVGDWLRVSGLPMPLHWKSRKKE